VHALCYVVNRGHRQYTGALSLAEQLHFCRQGHGRSGPCRDYVLAAVKELEALGVRDAGLHLLADRLKGAHEKHASS
jgi:cation transport protein ChaC